MKEIRLSFMIHLYEWSSAVYARVFKWKKHAWGISKGEFASYAPGTLGKALAEFYASNGFEVMPKLENHDVFHVLTQTGTTIQDEIAMQYLLLGNGKLSLYLFAMISIGTMLYPEHCAHFQACFRKGRRCQPFYQLEFLHLLDCPLETLQMILINKSEIVHI